MHKSATEYLAQIDFQIQFLHQYYNTQVLPKDALTIAKFQRVYKYIDESYRNGFMSEDELFNVYGYFLSTIKKFKRNVENRLYYNTSDYQATIEKLGRLNIRLVPIYHDLVLVERNPSIKMEDFLDVDFPHHIYSKQELVQFSLQIFDFLNFQQFKIPQIILEQLLQEMAYNYNVIPYHNFTHAFQLVQLLFSCFKKSKLKEFVNDLEIVFAVLAGLAHDLNHKGVNNAYKIKKSKKFNILTSETAVLENMHCATFFNIITLHRNLDIFSYLTNEDQKVQAKRLIITCILATDMGKHFKLLGKFQKRVESTVKYQPTDGPDELVEFQRLSSEKHDDRQFILNIMVHACDISNPCMGFQNYMNWSYLLSQEFMDQTIKEANIGVDVTGFLVYKDKPTFYGGQIGFSKNLVFPLWSTIGILFSDLQKEFRDIIIITQIMRLFNLRQWFCSSHPDQILQSLILQSKHSDVAAYLDQNPNNPNVKTWAKMIFSLNAAIKSEQKYFYQYYNTKQQVEEFIKLKGYEYRAEKNYRVVQIIRQEEKDNFQLSMIIHPQQRKIKKEVVKSLPLHKLHAFEEHFDYIRYKNALLKQDEEQNREVIKDTILDQANPLGINLDNLIAIKFFITVHKEDQYILLRCALSEGKIQFHDIQFQKSLDLAIPWTKQISQIIQNYEDQYKVEFIHLPDRLQIALLNFIKSFNVEAKDGHYIELISILQQQEQYVNWLQDAHDKIKNNQFN